MNSFITGSQVYGNQTPESDVDLCILVDKGTENKLAELAGGKYPIRFGNLNLICCNTEKEMNAWHSARDEVVSKGITDKATIIEIHDKWRKTNGVFYREHSGHGRQDYGPDTQRGISAY